MTPNYVRTVRGAGYSSHTTSFFFTYHDNSINGNFLIILGDSEAPVPGCTGDYTFRSPGEFFQLLKTYLTQITGFYIFVKHKCELDPFVVLVHTKKSTNTNA